MVILDRATILDWDKAPRGVSGVADRSSIS